MCENGIWCTQNSIFVLNFLIETNFKIETNWTLLVLGSLGKTTKAKDLKLMWLLCLVTGSSQFINLAGTSVEQVFRGLTVTL